MEGFWFRPPLGKTEKAVQRSQFRLLRTFAKVCVLDPLECSRFASTERAYRAIPLHSSEGCHVGEMSSTRRVLMQSDMEAHRGARRASRSTSAAIGTSVPIISSNITSSIISERKRPASDQKLDVSSEKGRPLPTAVSYTHLTLPTIYSV